MRFRIVMTREATIDLALLDNPTQRRIYAKLQYFARVPNPLVFSKPLTRKFRGLSRFRVGDYRVIFKTAANGELILLNIVRVAHRRQVYE